MQQTQQRVRTAQQDPVSNVCWCASREIDTFMPVAAHLLASICKMHQNQDCSDNDERPDVHTSTYESSAADILFVGRSEIRSVIQDVHETLGYSIELPLFLKSVVFLPPLRPPCLSMGVQ